MLKCYNYDIVCQEIPDEISLALNISNCPIHCHGCHSPWLWDDIGEPLDESLLCGIIDMYLSGITCVCFMGGDIAPNEIMSLASMIRSKYNSLKIAWYSGRDVLPDNFKKEYFDYVKLGPYIEQLGSLKDSTTNQKLYKILQDGSLFHVSF